MKYVNFGCGLNVHDEFINFDSSPSLFIKRLPLIGFLLKNKMPQFPQLVKYGNISKGLPIENESIDGIYSSHVIEHLSFDDSIKCFNNCYAYLKPNGIFRCVLPNFEALVNFYIEEKSIGNLNAANDFLTYSFLGKKGTSKSLFSFVKDYFSGANHLWMWDFESLSQELKKVGFKEIYKSQFNNSIDKHFNKIEIESRYLFDALCIEAIK
jgi:predicted SAM-dependent methyltransferase